MKTAVLVLLSLVCVACAYGIANVVSAVAVANGASATTGWMLGGGRCVAVSMRFCAAPSSWRPWLH